MKEMKLLGCNLHLRSIGVAEDINEKKREIRSQWDKLVEDFNDSAPPGLNKAFQKSGFWLFMQTEQAFYDGATQGMLISCTLAFIILLIGKCRLTTQKSAT